MKNDKRGILGFDTVKLVFLTLLMLAILFMVMALVLPILQSSSEAASIYTQGITNESINATVTGGAILACGQVSCPASFRNAVCSITAVYNYSIATGQVIPASNYTMTGCTISNYSTNYFPKLWTVNYSFSYNQPYVNNLVGNTTSGAANFFSYVPTFFILLAVVVLILIIAIVIVAVSRFGGSAIGG